MSDIELPLGLLFRPSRPLLPGGEGSARDRRPFATGTSSLVPLSCLPSGDTFLLVFGFAIDPCACFTGFRSGLKLSERQGFAVDFPSLLRLSVPTRTGGGDEIRLSGLDALFSLCLARWGGGEGRGEGDFCLRRYFFFGSGDGEYDGDLDLDFESNISELELESDLLLGGVGVRRFGGRLAATAADGLDSMSLDCLCGGDGLRSLGLFAFILLGGGEGLKLRLLSFLPDRWGGGGEGVKLRFFSPFLNRWGGGEGVKLRFLSPFLNRWGRGGEGVKLRFLSPFLNRWGGGEGVKLRFLSPFRNL